MEYIDDDFDKYYGVCPFPFHAVRIAKGQVYYFDEGNRYVWCLLKECKSYGIVTGVYAETVDELSCRYDLFARNKVRMYKALTSLKPLSTWNQFLDVWKNTELEAPGSSKKKISEFERGMGKIRPLEIWRADGNKKLCTFDFVRVSVPLVGNRERQLVFLSKWRKQLNELVLEHLQNNKKFTYYGVSVNYLRLVDVKLYYDGLLEYLFELKGVSNEKD